MSYQIWVGSGKIGCPYSHNNNLFGNYETMEHTNLNILWYSSPYWPFSRCGNENIMLENTFPSMYSFKKNEPKCCFVLIIMLNSCSEWHVLPFKKFFQCWKINVAPLMLMRYSHKKVLMVAFSWMLTNRRIQRIDKKAVALWTLNKTNNRDLDCLPFKLLLNAISIFCIFENALCIVRFDFILITAIATANQS